jgi:hypothetical protein
MMTSVETLQADAAAALKRFETEVDKAFAALPLPHPNGFVSRWYLLTVAEDSQRNLMVLPDKPVSSSLLEHYLDRYKYSLRSCLSRVRDECRDWTAMSLPESAAMNLYLKAQQMLIAGIDYSVASQICASAHAESASIEVVDGTYKRTPFSSGFG